MNVNFNNGNVNNNNKAYSTFAALLRWYEEKTMITYEQIYRSYLNCRKSKRNTINQLAFEVDADINLLRLQEELNDRSYRPSPSICFVLEKPKLREVFAATFRDRVVHHVLIEHLSAIYERTFIHDSYACRIGKGTHAAIDRLQKFCRSVTLNNTRRAYYMQLDVRSFFVEINKEILQELVIRRTRDEHMLWLSDVIIWNDCTDDCDVTRGGDLLERVPAHKTLFKAPRHKGLPIGNLTSQFFANLYLNELDQFIKRDLKVRHYIRYMDDLVLLSERKDQLQGWMSAIQEFLHKCLDLALHPAKRVIAPISNGIDFVGYIVRPKYILVRKRVVDSLKQRIRARTIDQNVWASYMGHFQHAQSSRLVSGLQKAFRRPAPLVR
jgi:RNA-directed DNA polymerase